MTFDVETTMFATRLQRVMYREDGYKSGVAPRTSRFSIATRSKAGTYSERPDLLVNSATMPGMGLPPSLRTALTSAQALS